MSLVSRRNAAAGWLAWRLGKRMLRRKAKAAAPGNHAKKPKALVAVLIAAGAGVATFLRLRSGEDEA